MMAQDDFRESMMADFLDESGQLLDRLNENLLQLDQWVADLSDEDDRQCDAGLLNEMFRSAHSIKGLSAMLGLTDINQLTHKIENVFDAARKGSLNVDGHIVELMFQSLDRLQAMVGLLRDPDAPPVVCDELVESIRPCWTQPGPTKSRVRKPRRSG
jgi:two-component system chemotaxis sensor kinase CheA